MAYEADIQRIKDSDGVVRDIPYQISRKIAVARLLIDAARKLAAESHAEAQDFLDRAGAGDEVDPFARCSPSAEQAFGDIAGYADLINSGHMYEVSRVPSVGYFDERKVLRDLLEDLFPADDTPATS